MQTVKEISTSNGVPVNLGPLVFILTVSAIKEIIEDYSRHKADAAENNMLIDVLQIGDDGNRDFQKTESKNIRVGNIVMIKEDQFFPCDLCLLKTSTKKGVAYVETKNLDGETNLKMKFTHKDI